MPEIIAKSNKHYFDNRCFSDDALIETAFINDVNIVNIQPVTPFENLLNNRVSYVNKLISNGLVPHRCLTYGEIHYPNDLTQTLRLYKIPN